MCLYVLRVVPKGKESGFGYKVYSKEGNKLYSPLYNNGKPKPINKWLDASEDLHSEDKIRVSTAYPGEYYVPGWHFYLRKKDLIDWGKRMWGWDFLRQSVIRKIKYKEATAFGADGKGGEQGVSKYILILPERKGK